MHGVQYLNYMHSNHAHNYVVYLILLPSIDVNTSSIFKNVLHCIQVITSGSPNKILYNECNIKLMCL